MLVHQKVLLSGTGDDLRGDKMIDEAHRTTTESEIENFNGKILEGAENQDNEKKQRNEEEKMGDRDVATGSFSSLPVWSKVEIDGTNAFSQDTEDQCPIPCTTKRNKPIIWESGKVPMRDGGFDRC